MPLPTNNDEDGGGGSKHDDERERLLADDRQRITYSEISGESPPGIQSKKLPQYIATVLATGGALAGGTVFGWSSPAESRLIDRSDDPSFIGEYGFHITSEQWSWIGSLVTLGASLMCLLTGMITNLIGRKMTMLFLIIPFAMGWSLCIFAENVEMLYVGRFLLGIAGGSFYVVTPMYICEIAEKSIRGKLASLFQLMTTIGILFVYCIGYNLTVHRFSLICAAIPIIFGLTFMFMPDTPLYLISKNRHDDAIRALLWLRGGTDHRGDHHGQYDCTDEITELQMQYTIENMNRTSIWHTLKQPTAVKGLIIGFGLMFFMQFSAINVVIFYTGSIFAAAKSNIDPAISIIIVGFMQTVATFIAAMITDRLGRRILLITSILIMAICKLLLGIYFYLDTNRPEVAATITWLPLLALVLYIIAFSIGMGPIPWVIIGEMFSSDIKGLASSIVSAFGWFLAFVVTKFYINLRDAIGLGPSFWFFTVFSIIGTIFIIFVVPETKGKSLREIQEMLARNNNSDLINPNRNSNNNNNLS